MKKVYTAMKLNPITLDYRATVSDENRGFIDTVVGLYVRQGSKAYVLVSVTI